MDLGLEQILEEFKVMAEIMEWFLKLDVLGVYVVGIIIGVDIIRLRS